jgi:hypothetical protein
MRNEKGQFGTGNNGRPKGTPNRTTTEIRDAFQQLVSGNLEQLQEDLANLEGFQRVKLIIELSKFVIPTLRATELKASEDGFNPITISFQE